MEKLKVVTEFFDKLRADDDDTVYTEKKIMEVLEELDVLQYETILDVPTAIVNQILAHATEGLCPRLNPNQEQEMLDFFEEILVQCKIEYPIMAKSLRYLLRNEKSPKAALIVVDVQNDFISGSLALSNGPAGQDGAEVVPVINNILDTKHFHKVFYSIDWHPGNHSCFHDNVSNYELDESSPISAENANIMDKVVYKGEDGKPVEQVMWPVHCIQGSDGAELHEDLNVVEGAIKIYKGQNPRVDSYSAIWDNGRLARSKLLEHLFDNDITHIFTCGLATDFCVGMTSLDAAEHGFDVYLVTDACRGIADESIEEMTDKMTTAGCIFIESSEIMFHYDQDRKRGHLFYSYVMIEIIDIIDEIDKIDPYGF